MNLQEYLKEARTNNVTELKLFIEGDTESGFTTVKITPTHGFGRTAEFLVDEKEVTTIANTIWHKRVEEDAAGAPDGNATTPPTAGETSEEENGAKVEPPTQAANDQPEAPAIAAEDGADQATATDQPATDAA